MPKPSTAQDCLLAELAHIEKKIGDLVREKVAISSVLLRIRREDVALRDVHRKNSINRIMVENAVLAHLTEAKKPLETRVLFKIANDVLHDVKAVSFRSTLHRMKGKGLIASKADGLWVLPPPK